MKTKAGTHRVGLVSLGCAKNLVDSEHLLRQLKANQIEFIHDPGGWKGVETAIINTCGFIGDAKKESVDTILKMVNAKKHHQLGRIFVMGCLSQRYKEELRQEIPEVDGYFGVDELPAIISKLGGQFRYDLVGERLRTTPGHYAYLKIAEGCDRHCSFCAIPAIRGKHRSRPVEEIINEANRMVGDGVREINLISQDTTYYGLDIYHKRLLPELMESLARIENLVWLRLHYTFPHGFPESLLDVISAHPNICKYVDIPLQHISDRILTSMHRGMDGYSTRKLIDKIRHTIPDVAIRTTFITGYPGETTREFRELRDFLEQSRFDRVGVFPYSHEEGTDAFGLKDSVSHSAKLKRAEELMAVQEPISRSLNQARIGSVCKVVIDRKEGEFYIGRTEYDSPEIDNEVLIAAHNSLLEPGQFCQAKISGAESYDLFAELV